MLCDGLVDRQFSLVGQAHTPKPGRRHWTVAGFSTDAPRRVAGWIGSVLATFTAFCLQSHALSLIITYLQGKLNIADPGQPCRQWSLPYILSSMVTAVSIYCGNFGDTVWKSSPTWVSP